MVAAKEPINTIKSIKDEYLRLKNKLMRQPNRDELYEVVSKSYVEKYFENYGNLVKEMGDTPKVFGKKGISEEEFLTSYGEMVRKIGAPPKSTQWTHIRYKHNLNIPDQSAFKKKFKVNWPEISNIFLGFANNKPEWADVIPLIQITTQKETQPLKIVGQSVEIASKYLPFIPPALNDLLALSVSEGNSTEFERKVNLLFQLLGFEMEKNLGQGTGRKPDGIAKAAEFHFAIIIDAKARKDSYQIGQDDRKFIEYIKDYNLPLKRQGCDSVYFLIVTSNVGATSEKALKKIFTDTNTVTKLITVKSLLKILALKIEHPTRFDFKKFKELFDKSGIITETEIDKFLKTFD